MVKRDALHEGDLLVINACCCCNCALYPTIPDCLGCSAKGELCCFEVQTCLKLGTPCFGCKAFGEDACVQCGLGCCAVGCKIPSVCCKAQEQLCCIAVNAALPPDEEIPASVALLCCQVYPSCGPCKRLKVPVPKFGRPRAGGGAPDAADIVVELGSPKFCIIADREHAYA